jgi:hypothetical protein
MVGVQLSQNTNINVISPSWILLDTCSTASVSNNWSLVGNIRACTDNNTLVLSTNGGPVSFNEMADLKLFEMTVHFNENTMATVLSLSDERLLMGYILP